MDEIRFNDAQSIEAFRGTIAPWFNGDKDVAVARHKDGEILGGVVYTDYYTNHSVSMHVHSWRRHWLNRDFLFVAFDYPFNQLHVKHIFGTAREDSIAFDLNVGFRVVARIADYYPGAAKVVLRMDREECRYLNMKPKRISAVRSDLH